MWRRSNKIKTACILLAFVCCVCAANAQERKRTPLIPPAFRGISAHFDVASPIMGLVAGGAHNYEALVDVSIYDRFFPCLEVGYAYISNSVSERSYTSQAPFFRLGMNFNLMKTVDNNGNPKNVRNYAFLGLRYSFAPVTYSIDNVQITDDYWGTSGAVEFPQAVEYAGWAEIVGGVRVDLIAGFTMGWSVRVKLLMHSSADSTDLLWYVPGYGRNATSAFTFNYTVGYTFKTPKARKLFNPESKK